MKKIKYSYSSGAVLVLSLFVLMILSITIASLSKDIIMDLNMSRNIKLYKDAFNWAESGLNLTEEIIAYAVDSRGDDANSTMSFALNGTTYSMKNNNNFSIWNNVGSLSLSKSNKTLADISTNFIGSKAGEGGSIIIAAGYEGAGKGAGSGVGIARFYSIKSDGNSSVGNGKSTIAEVYRFTSGGR